MSTPTKYEGHTPGPWTAHTFPESAHQFPHVHIGKVEVWPEVNETNRTWAVGAYSGQCKDYLTINVNESRQAGTFEADARLIADAPALLAENTRLREALRKIAYEPFGPADASFQAVLDSVIGCAQQALAAGKGETVPTEKCAQCGKQTEETWSASDGVNESIRVCADCKGDL